MPRLRVLGLCLALMVPVAFSSGTGAADAGRQSAVPAHRLPASPHGPAFVFGLKGGFSTVGQFTITLYVDGRVKLQTFQPHSRIRLTDPKVKVYPIALTALLKLAQAERFFTMPARIVAKHPVSDMATAFISVHTTAGVKTVSVYGVNPPRFYELYALLNYVAGATS